MTSSQSYTFPAEFVYAAHEGIDMIPINDHRLARLDISHIKLPYFKHQSFYLLVKHEGYVHFMHALQQMNYPILLDRPTTEACWVKVFTPLYQAWDPSEQALREDGTCREAPFLLKMRLLTEAKRQMNDDAAQRYWHMKMLECGPLNIKTALSPMTKEEEVDYDLWMMSVGGESRPEERLTELDRMLIGDLPWDDDEEEEDYEEAEEEENEGDDDEEEDEDEDEDKDEDKEEVERLDTIAEEDRMEE